MVNFFEFRPDDSPKNGLYHFAFMPYNILISIKKQGGMKKNFRESVDKKIDHFIFVLIGNGLFLLILGVLIVWTDFMLKLLVGLLTITIAYVFFYGAYKLFSLKKHLDKIIKF